jgi:hypothetical protein
MIVQEYEIRFLGIGVLAPPVHQIRYVCRILKDTDVDVDGPTLGKGDLQQSSVCPIIVYQQYFTGAFLIGWHSGAKLPSLRLTVMEAASAKLLRDV